jgi:hypothetical protein
MEVTMKILSSLATALAVLLLSVNPAAASATANSAPASKSGTFSPLDVSGIYSVTACQDTTTVAVSGSSEYATNRVRVSLLVQNSDGDYILTRQVNSANFGSGNFWLPVVVDYHTQPVNAGTSLEVIVQLQRSSSSGFVDLGSPVTTYVTAADHNCLNQCAVTITTRDRAPVNGVITLRSHFGSWFRPEGWLHGVVSVTAGQTVQATLADVPCGAWVRAWFYPSTGADRTPRLLPSQFWPAELGTSVADTATPYATSFASGLPATKPLESDDPYAPR